MLKTKTRTKRRSTEAHVGAAQRELISILPICRSATLMAKQRKWKRFEGTLRLSESSPAESLRTSNNSDWFTCQTLLCSDILPAPCGVCALVRMPACTRLRASERNACHNVCGCIRLHTRGHCLYALRYVLVEVAGGGAPTSHGPGGLDLPFQRCLRF